VDEKGFHEYLSGLSLSEITGNYSFNSFETRVQYLMNTPKGTLAVTLSDNVIKITELYGGNPKTEHYYIRDGVDWEYLEEFIKEYPGLNMVFSRKGDSYLARCMMQSFILI
jgi:hypothetical protein